MATAEPKVKSTSELAKDVETLTNRLTPMLDAFEKPDYRGKSLAQMFGYRQAPHGTSGPLGDSEGYSVLKAVAFSMGHLPADQAKQEIETHNKLFELYKHWGFTPHYGRGAFLVPSCSAHIPPDKDGGRKLQSEVRQKMTCHQGEFDPEEAQWINKRLGGHFTKALGTVSDAAGGVLVGFPTLGELIDLQRNLEAFPNAGAMEIALPPNGRIQFPKLSGGATAYWVGEASAVTESTQTTGDLDLVAKKLGCMVKMNNELLRFNSISAEGMVRLDIARVSALKADLGMLEGTGGTQILGLTKYPTQTAWSPGNDKLILHVAGVVGGNGDTFQPEDVALMEGKLPDVIQEPTAWLMRKNFFSVIMNRRGDSAVPGDGKGPFMFWVSRGSAAEKPPMELWGTKVTRTSQISNTRAKGSATNLTYAILGYFPDWIIARSGVLEFLATSMGDTAFQNDQTWLRGIQYIDAGARHPASFVMVDSLQIL
jgi:HK97 family phage major capsid protein